MPPKPDPNTIRRVCMNCGKDLDGSHICKADECRQRDTEIIAHMVALVHARSRGDYFAAVDARRELEQRGVLVRFLRKRKGSDGK